MRQDYITKNNWVFISRETICVMQVCDQVVQLLYPRCLWLARRLTHFHKLEVTIYPENFEKRSIEILREGRN